MFSFHMDVDTACEFYRRAAAAKAETEEARTKILIQMVEEGLITTVVQTNRTKEEYVSDLAKNFEVLDLTEAANEHEEN